jgi:RNase P/RNase MRP subunit POP5
MIIKIKDINNNITFELLIESNILINDLHKRIRKVHNQYLGNNGIDVIRINGSLHILYHLINM